jgi:predicted acetyltransferase
MLNRMPFIVCGLLAQYLYGIATVPEYRGRGYAGKLIAEALQSPKYEIAALIPENPSLIGFYERFGFVRYGEPFKSGRTVLAHSAIIRTEEVYNELVREVRLIENEE